MIFLYKFMSLAINALFLLIFKTKEVKIKKYKNMEKQQ